MTENEEETERTIVQIRISKDNKEIWKEFCEEKGITLTEFLKRAGNLVIYRPELWDNPFARNEGAQSKTFEEKLFNELDALKKLVIEGKDLQREKINELLVELGDRSKREELLEKEYVKQVLKNKVRLLLTEKPMTLEEIRKRVSDPLLQPHLLPEKGKPLAILDVALTELRKEGFIEHRNKIYSSLEDSF